MADRNFSKGYFGVLQRSFGETVKLCLNVRTARFFFVTYLDVGGLRIFAVSPDTSSFRLRMHHFFVTDLSVPKWNGKVETSRAGYGMGFPGFGTQYCCTCEMVVNVFFCGRT